MKLLLPSFIALGFVFSSLGSLAYGPMSLPQDPDGAYLDARYPGLIPPIVIEGRDGEPTKSDVLGLIANQSPVKSQGSRGTCSIFSATAILESMLVIQGVANNQIDLSEEYLEYLAMQNSTTDGSTSTKNFRNLSRYGVPYENTWPYIGMTWEDLSSSPDAEKLCGALSGTVQKSCLLGHRNPRLLNATDKELANTSSALYDPEFLKARREAQANLTKLFPSVGSSYYVFSTSEVKELLRLGIPVTLDSDFYYGAWNHRVAEELGIPRNLDHWAKGIVGYPAMGSVDREKSLSKPAGHSIVLVGYDDDLEVTVDTLMTDGTIEKKTYKGVYYFKNSWGTQKFGVEFQVDGQKHPGYGMITQEYAHEFGSFYRLPLN